MPEKRQKGVLRPNESTDWRRRIERPGEDDDFTKSLNPNSLEILKSAQLEPGLPQLVRKYRQRGGHWLLRLPQRGPDRHHDRHELSRQRSQSLDELRLQAVEASAETRTELGRDDDLIAELARLVAEHPVRERLVAMTLDVAGPGPDEMKRKVEADAARWARLAQELKLEPLD